MKFCPECDNIMIPKEGKLYCKACDEYFELGSDQKEYKIVKTIKHDDKETAPIVIKESMKSSRISLEDRKAYEEFFGNSEESGY